MSTDETKQESAKETRRRRAREAINTIYEAGKTVAPRPFGGILVKIGDKIKEVAQATRKSRGKPTLDDEQG